MIRKKMVYYRPCIPLPSLAAGIRTYNGRLKAAVPRRSFHTHHSNVFHIFGILQGEISILMLKKELQNDSFCSSSPFYFPYFRPMFVYRSSVLRILPLMVLGSDSRNSTIRGYL